jgi:hypothetical protein
VPTDEEMKESWSAPGDPAVLRREFEGWDPRIGNVLKQVDKTFRWALYGREPVPTWTKGRLTLLGDAGGARQNGLRVDSACSDLSVRDQNSSRTPNSESTSRSLRPGRARKCQRRRPGQAEPRH